MNKPNLSSNRAKTIGNYLKNSLIAPLLTSVAVLLMTGSIARAQVTIDVSGVSTTQIPIAIAGFTTEQAGNTDVAAVIRSDLGRSGSFKLIDGMPPTSELASIDYATWRNKSVDALVTGSVTKLANGKYDVRFRLSDTLSQKAIENLSIVSTEGDMRATGHRIADIVFEKLTGEKGIFSTRIAFVSKGAGMFKLNVADWDGDNIQTALNSPEPIMSPSWAPDGSRLAYVSFENKKPVVYVQNIFTQQRSVVANQKGSNSAPAWAPDGKTLAVALTKHGLSQIYAVNADGTGLRRLSESSAIDTEPRFSPDGSTIYFTSDRGGSPQIYRMPAAGGEAKRVTFNGTYNVSPRISPDGKRLAYLTRRDGKYSLALRDLSGTSDQILTDTGRDESPSFSPNGKWVLYATRTAGKDFLMAITTDSKVKQRLTSSGSEIREPSWGPFVR